LDNSGIIQVRPFIEFGIYYIKPSVFLSYSRAKPWTKLGFACYATYSLAHDYLSIRKSPGEGGGLDGCKLPRVKDVRPGVDFMNQFRM
jgi:hypothetical protein